MGPERSSCRADKKEALTCAGKGFFVMVSFQLIIHIPHKADGETDAVRNGIIKAHGMAILVEDIVGIT